MMNADRHPDPQTLEAFREHRLAGTEVLSIAAHVGRCAACATATDRDGEAVLLALVSRGGEDHLSDDDLDLLAGARAGDPSYRQLWEHAAACAMCGAELEDLRRFTADEAVLRRFPSRDGGRWRWLGAAAAILVVALSIVAIANRRAPMPPRPQAAPPVASKSPSTPAPQTTRTVASPVVASLVDESGRIEMREDGTVAGIEVASPADAESARAALSGHAVSIPAFIAAMPGAVRSGTAVEAPPIRPVEPFRSAVRDVRPRFTWTPVGKALSYRAAVYDADYEEVASSEPLTTTSWRPSKPLPSGVDLTWQVVASTPEGEISSAGSDRAEAVFRILSPGDEKELARDEALYRHSYLLRGLLYSRFGLLHDAEREFRHLAAINPSSPVTAKLMASVSGRQ